MADDPHARRSRYWLWGIGGWLAITALCLVTHLGSLQADLADRSQAALASAGLAGQLSGGEIDFNGEIATLRGTVTDAAVRDQIAAVVGDMRGVRRIDNEITVAAPAAAPAPTPTTTLAPAPTTVPPAPPAALRSPTVTAVAEGTTITLSGEVPSREVADAWLAAAADAYGADNVVDRLTVTDEVATPQWLASSDSLLLLASTTDGSLTVGDDGVVITGAVADQAASDEIAAALVAGFEGVALDNRLEIAPQASDEIAALDLAGISFATGSATITAESIPILDEAVRVLDTFPEIAVEIAGHTDSDGSAAANLELSQRRAEAVLQYLVDGGIDSARLTAVGYGETEPVASNATPEGKAQNRRIEFTITEGE